METRVPGENLSVQRREPTNSTHISGHEIAPNTVANATKMIVLATKIQKLVAKLATRTLWVLYILHLCFLQLNEALK